MLELPTHNIYLVKRDGTKESIMIGDCSTSKEVRDEVRYSIDMMSKHKDISEYIKAEYTNNNGDVLYTCTIEECMEEL